MTRWFTILVVALASCDSGGVVPRDWGPGDVSSSDTGSLPDSDIMAEVGGLDLSDAAAAPDDLSGGLDWRDATGPEGLQAPDTGLEISVIPNPYIPANSFRLEPAGFEGDALVVHVVARDFGALFGVALRVEWDPEVLVLRDTTLEPVFGEAGTTAIYKAAQVRPGSLALAWAFLGSKQEAPLSGDVRLATLKFGVVKAGASPIAFFEPRCLALTRRLEKVEAVYLSAAVSP